MLRAPADDAQETRRPVPLERLGAAERGPGRVDAGERRDLVVEEEVLGGPLEHRAVDRQVEAGELFDVLVDAPGQRVAGNELAARLHLAKGAHGVAGLLAWPGRYTRKLGRVFPIATEGRPDGGTDYFMDPAIATLFAQARDRAR